MVSGVGVLDKSVVLLDVLAEANPSLALNQVAKLSGIPKPTAHRLLSALEVHGLARRDQAGSWALGSRLVTLGKLASAGWPLAEVARPALEKLRSATGESVQLYVAEGHRRRCVASLESEHELRTIVAEGATLPLKLGSAGRVLRGEVGPEGWVASVGERQEGVASVSAPVVVDGAMVGAVGISGPIGRLGHDPGPKFGQLVLVAAAAIAQTAERR